jgi:hypothetical protein
MNFSFKKKGDSSGDESFLHPSIANYVKDGRDSSERKVYLDTEKEAAWVERQTVLK